MPAALAPYTAQKPSGPGVSLNRDHPLAQNLLYGWLLGDGLLPAYSDVAQGVQAVTQPTGVAVDTSILGPGLTFTAASPGGLVTDASVAADTNGISQLTVSVWVRPLSMATGAARVLLGHANLVGSASYVIATSATDYTTLLFIVDATGANTGASPTLAIFNGTFSHVAMVFDGSGTGNAGRLKGYINGLAVSLVFTGTIPATVPSVNLPLAIATTSDKVAGNSFNGLVDLPMVWGRALSPEEVWSLYATPYAMFTTRPVRRWFVPDPYPPLLLVPTKVRQIAAAR